jgi:hypothetical protein
MVDKQFKSTTARLIHSPTVSRLRLIGTFGLVKKGSRRHQARPALPSEVISSLQNLHPHALTPQTQEQASALPAILTLSTRQVCDVGVTGQRLSNLLASIDLTDLNQTTTSLGNGLADNFGRLGFTLGTDNVCLALLLGALDDESRPLGVLLGDLLLLDGAGEFLAEGHVGDGDVFEGDVELRCALEEVVADSVGDGFTLGD